MVFISYASQDTEIANSVREKLINADIKCWMAPYSIEVETDYVNAVSEAVLQCSVFVLILTQAANDSVWVSKELDIAILNNKKIIPFKVGTIDDDVNKFTYRLSDTQIVEYNSDDRDASYSALFQTVLRLHNN